MKAKNNSKFRYGISTLLLINRVIRNKTNCNLKWIGWAVAQYDGPRIRHCSKRRSNVGRRLQG